MLDSRAPAGPQRGEGEEERKDGEKNKEEKDLDVRKFGRRGFMTMDRRG